MQNKMIPFLIGAALLFQTPDLSVAFVTRSNFGRRDVWRYSSAESPRIVISDPMLIDDSLAHHSADLAYDAKTHKVSVFDVNLDENVVCIRSRILDENGSLESQTTAVIPDAFLVIAGFDLSDRFRIEVKGVDQKWSAWDRTKARCLPISGSVFLSGTESKYKPVSGRYATLLDLSLDQKDISAFDNSLHSYATISDGVISFAASEDRISVPKRLFVKDIISNGKGTSYAVCDEGRQQMAYESESTWRMFGIYIIDSGKHELVKLFEGAGISPVLTGTSPLRLS